MSDRVGKTVPENRTCIGKGSLSLKFLTAARNAEDSCVSRGAKCSRRGVQFNQIRKVWGCRARKNVEAQNSKFVVDPLLYWKPM